jgi:phosphate/sulfate permease
MGVFLLYFLLAIGVAMYAAGKGKSAYAFLFLSLIFTPIVGGLFALIANPDPSIVRANKLKSGKYFSCPYCKQIINAKVSNCNFCGKEVHYAGLGIPDNNSTELATAQTKQLNTATKVLSIIVIYQALKKLWR